MKILVTGATGFIGRRLALMARADGDTVVATGQSNTDAEVIRGRELKEAGVDLRIGSVTDAGFLTDTVTGCEAVIHLAAAQHEMNVPDEHFENVNVTGTRQLLDAAIRAGVSRFVYGSTIGVYGSAAQGALDENSRTAPDNVYGRTKLVAEGVVRQYGDRIDTRIVRISETYGPGDFRLLKLFRAIDKGAFVMIGSGQNLRQLIHVDDLCRGILLATRLPDLRGELYVLAGAEVMTTREMVDTVSVALGRKPRRWHLPLWPFSVAAAVLETTLRPLGIQPPLHRRRLDFFRKSFFFHTGRSAAALNFTPSISFADGAVETARAYRKQGLL